MPVSIRSVAVRGFVAVLTWLAVAGPVPVAAHGEEEHHGADAATMQAMMEEPHHLLAAAYRDSLENFAQALLKVAGRGDTIPSDFARRSVAEMTRSLEMLEKEHGEIVRTMPGEAREQLGAMPQMMKDRLAQVKGALAPLNDLVKKEPVPSQEVMKVLLPVFHGENGMNLKKHDDHPGGGAGEGMEPQRNTGPELSALVEALEQAPAADKPALLEEIVKRLVREREALRAGIGDMHGRMKSHMVDHMQIEGECDCPDLNDCGDNEEE